MLQVELTASKRNVTGKGAMRRLRSGGLTPGVVYGKGTDVRKLQLDTKSLMAKLLKYYRRNAIVILNIDGGSEKNVIIGEVQTDPVRDTLIHIDFCEIDLNKDRDFNVNVKVEGVAKGVDLGGVMSVAYPEIVLQGKPLDIPDELIVDVTSLDLGEKIECGTIAIPDNVTLVTDPSAVCVSIVKAGQKEEELEEDVDGEEDGETAEDTAEEETAAE